jgi:hypothetical protein
MKKLLSIILLLFVAATVLAQAQVTTRTITGTIRKPDGAAWVGAQVKFELTKNTYTADASFPASVVTATTNLSGQLCVAPCSVTGVTLWTNAEGIEPAQYKVSYPDGKYFYFYLAAGSSIDLSTLRLTSTQPAGGVVESALQQIIDEEAAARAAADTTLQANIASEASARASADATLQANITSEANTRSAADTTLQTNITNEATARANADATLQANIDGKAPLSHTHTASEITNFNAAVDARISYPVTSVFGRTGAVTPQTNDYTWGQINKSTSSLADITTRSASDLSSGTLPDARFPSTLPAVSGANLTALNASNLASGTVPSARLSLSPSDIPTLTSGKISDFASAAASNFPHITDNLNSVSIDTGGSGGVSMGDLQGAGNGTTIILDDGAGTIQLSGDVTINGQEPLFTAVTNGAGANVIPKSDGTNFVASHITDDDLGVAISSTVNLGSQSLSAGSIFTQGLQLAGNLIISSDGVANIGTSSSRVGDIYLKNPAITSGSGTGINPLDRGSVRTLVSKVTISRTPFSAAATTADVTIATLPAKTQLHGIWAELTQVFSGGSVSAATMVCGKTAGGNEYLVSFDVKSATLQRGLVDGDLGTSINRANAVQGGDMPSWSSTTAVRCRLTTTGANTSALTQGSITFYLKTTQLP